MVEITSAEPGQLSMDDRFTRAEGVTDLVPGVFFSPLAGSSRTSS